MLKTIVATLHTVMGSSLSQQSAVDTITQWRSRPPHVLIFDSSRREISQYMEAVDKLTQSPPNSKETNNKDLIAIAMARLKREFIAVLSRQADYQAGGPISTITTTAEFSSVADSTAYAFRYEDYVISDLPSTDVITYLKNIAQRMNSGGKLADCIRAYKSVRRTFLQAQLSRLRFEELSVNLNAKRYLWDELKIKMEFWVQLSKICVKKLFDREKKLCDQIFQGIVGINGPAKDECFVGTVQDFAAGLFSFAESMSLSNQPYERMETVFTVYDSFLSILPNVKALFDSVPGREIVIRCEETLSNVEIEVTRMLHDFEDAVLHEKPVSNSSDENGSVHQRTEYVMDKITLIAKNKNLLTSLIKSTPSLTFGNSVIPQDTLGEDYTSNRSFLDRHLILIIVVLEQNLHNKADSYANPTLGHLFMMNNLRYILLKIGEFSELKEMIGDPFMKSLNEDFELAKTSYQESTCDKFLNCFKEEGLYNTCCFMSRPLTNAVRERVKAFNGAFEEITVAQCNWVIPDSRLREEVRVSMKAKLVPAYKKFLEDFGSDVKMKLILDKNVKYSIEDLEILVLVKLFGDGEISA
ncbi:hypothetical protein ABFS82_09G124700 [Erythranthe guttata]